MPILGRVALLGLLFTALSSCSSGSDSGDSGVSAPPIPETGFAISVEQSAIQVIEGATTIAVPIRVARAVGEQTSISLSLSSPELTADSQLSASFTMPVLTAGTNEAELLLQYALSAAPIQAQSFVLQVTASDGVTTRTQDVAIDLTPTAAPDVYLLLGQSNMTGNSELGAKQAGTGQLDAPDPRIDQLNVTANERDQYTETSDFTDLDNIVATPALIPAEDPLHMPGNGNGKAGTQIGPGLSFAKAALADTTSQVLLVPAAFGGTGFCSVSDSPIAWNDIQRDNTSLGGTGLYDRAVARANHALEISGGILRGILWHQGETDGDRDGCGQVYAENLREMADALVADIQEDDRGAIARGASSDVPFVLGTLSRGNDERGNFGILTAAQQQVDNAHRSISATREHTGLVNNDDLVPPGFPCGADSCIHFGATAYREMGMRYYDMIKQLW